MSAVLAGLGACVPPRAVSNAMLTAELDTSDEWIRTRTGIHTRYVVAPGMSTGHLATEAGRRALRSADMSAVDAVVLATSTPDRLCPATAPLVASRLGLIGAAAFDVAAVCTGFVYALATGAGLLSCGAAGSVLVIGADTFSTILDPADRTTRVIFGDGAGAVVLRLGTADEPGALLGFDLGSDGAGADLITVRAGGSEQRSTGLPAELADTYFRMHGKPVFYRAVRRMTESALTVVKQVGWEIDEIDRFVAHQANTRILNNCVSELGLPQDRLVVNIDRVGNTVAASVPLALAQAAADGGLRPGHRTVLTGFGGGLTWGSTALNWPELTVEDPITGTHWQHDIT